MHSTLTSSSRASRDVQPLLERLVGTSQGNRTQVAVYPGGELVVHAWSGLADPERGRPIDRDTRARLTPIKEPSTTAIAKDQL